MTSRVVRLPRSALFAMPLLCALAVTTAVQAAGAIKIGLGMALSGQLAANGKAALVGMKIWEL